MSSRAWGALALSLWAALAAHASAAVQAGEVTLRHTPRPGERTEVRVSTRHELVVDRLVTVIGEREPSVLVANLAAEGAASLKVIEEVRAIDARGVVEARREYGEAEASVVMRDSRAAVDAPPLSRVEFRSELAGASVRQQRRADGSFGRHYDAREAREALLADVADPLDLQSLAPARSVAVGAEWDLAPGALAAALAPFGDVGWRAVDEGADPELIRSFQQGLGGNLHLGLGAGTAGKARAQLFGLEVVERERRATVRVTFELTLATDHTEALRRRAPLNEREEGVEVLSATGERRLAGTLEVVWSVERERVVSAKLVADEALALSIRVQPEEGDAATQTVALAGRCVVQLDLVPLAPSTPSATPDGR